MFEGWSTYTKVIRLILKYIIVYSVQQIPVSPLHKFNDAVWVKDLND